MSDTPAVRTYQPPANMHEAFARLATVVAPVLPKGMDPKQFVGLVGSCMAKTPKLRNCKPESFIHAVRELAELGLYPGTSAAALAYLIPKGGECQPRVGYRGLEELAFRKGWMLYGDAVNKGDIFHYELGANPSLVHKPRRAQPSTGAEVTHAYAICKDIKTGVLIRVTVIDREEIERRRHMGDGADQAWWKNNYPVMSAKSAVRAQGMRLPLAPGGLSLTDRGISVDLDEEVSARPALLELSEEGEGTAAPTQQTETGRPAEDEVNDGDGQDPAQGRLV